VRCRASIARYRSAAHNGKSADDLRRIEHDLRQDCIETIRDDACRKALAGEYSSGDYDAAMVHVAAACRDAYCPRLPVFKPTLCNTTGEPARDGPTRGATIVLLAAIRAYELDTPLAELADIPPPNLPPPVLTARGNDGLRVVLLRLTCTPGGTCELALLDAACAAMGHWPLGAPAIGEALRDAGTTAARLSASPEVPYAKVIATIDQLRELGVMDVSFVGPQCNDAGSLP
jgi:hypothetical protein